MDTDWTQRDIIDLEYCLDRDSNKSHEQLHRRDRAIFLECCNDREDDPQQLLHHWLTARRRALFDASGRKSPGSQVATSLRLLTLLLYGLGLVLGGAAGLSFFNYSGTNPVNVFHFLLLFIVPQLIMLVLLLGATVIRLTGISLWPSLLVRLFIGTLPFLSGRHGAGAKRLSGLLRRITTAYSSLLYWPLFLMAQKFMAFLNTGLLAATLLKISTTDQAFGWQSTIQLSTPLIHRIVNLLAAPWSWLVPERFAYPSLAEIEGSRIILKDGVYHLATQDLVSWWPFLVLALLTYGLLLRLLLVPFGVIMHHRSLRRLNLHRPDLLRIVQRMRTPLLDSVAADAPDQLSAYSADGDRQSTSTRDRYAPSDRPLLSVVPDDLADKRFTVPLDHLLSRHGLPVGDREILRSDEPLPADQLQRIAEACRSQQTGLLLITEAWLPPINEWLHTLRQIRAAIGTTTPIFVGLVGSPTEEDGFATPLPQDRLLWQHKLQELGDPFLSVFELSAGNRRAAQDSP